MGGDHVGEEAADREFDVCIVGSGFGGAMMALPLVEAGLDVLMVERGDWVPRGIHNWAPDATIDLTPYYSMEAPFRVVEGGNAPEMGIYSCVGGPSVFYGGVSLRYRERDFEPEPSLVADSGARWPFGYAELEPHYTRAERLLDVAGEDGADPIEPPRSEPYPQRLPPLSELSRAIAGAGESLGLRPFPLPLAINYRAGARRCVACPTCDTFACAVSAKNDLATGLLPDLIEQGLTLVPRTAALELERDGRRLSALRCFDKGRGAQVRYRARWFALAAGALASPQLALCSGLDRLSPAADAVGAYLMRHVNAISFGFFPRLPGRADTFHKQVGFHDFYFGASRNGAPDGKLGCIQQLHSPPIGLVRTQLPRALGPLAAPFVRRMTGLLVMAEDQPAAANRVRLGAARTAFGLPQLEVRHRYSSRDLAARGSLQREAKRILRRAGAVAFYTHVIRTFSHAVGTMRMGPVPEDAPIDGDCRFRGVENLSVVDASVLPTSAGLNPSLTISANALRAGEQLVASGAL